MPSRSPVKKVGTIVREDDMTQHLPAARAHGACAGEKNRIDLLHAGGHRDHDRKHAMADAKSDLGRGADAEDQHEDRQDRDLRQAIEQKNDRHEALMGEPAEPDGKSDARSDHRRQARSRRQFRYSVSHSADGTPGVPNRLAERHQHFRRRADEVAIEKEARRDLPDDRAAGSRYRAARRQGGA